MYIKFKYKLLTILCIVLMLTTFIISGIWYKYSKEMIVENVYQSMGQLLKERDKALMSSVRDVAFQTRTLTYNNTYVDACLNNKWKDAYLREQAQKKLTDAITSIYVNNPLIQSIEIGNDTGDEFFLGQKLGKAFIQERVKPQLDKNQTSEYILLGTGENPYEPNEIVLYRNIYYYGKNIGYCMVTLLSYNVPQIYEGNFPNEAVISIRTKNGTYLYTSKNYSQMLTNDILINEMNEMEDGHKNIKDFDRKEWLLLGENLEEGLIQTCVAIPVDTMLGDIKNRFAEIFIISGFMMGLLLIVVSIVTRWIGRNIDILSNAIQNFSQGSLDTKIELNSKDEFGKVAQAFNHMTEDIKQLMTDIKIQEQEKVTLEIRSLQGQINLHFLFNTLNTIKNLCYVQRVTNVEHLVDALMQLLHISMEQEEEYIELNKELEYINSYLEIYQYKSVYPIRCFMEIDPSLKSALVLKFSIQPIIENAIIHGLEGSDKDEDGLIYIKAIRDKEDLEITVTDNGKGFDTSKITTLNGIGLSNTEKRIKIHFGESYGIKAESIEGISTSITIRMPYRRIEDGI